METMKSTKRSTRILELAVFSIRLKRRRVQAWRGLKWKSKSYSNLGHNIMSTWEKYMSRAVHPFSLMKRRFFSLIARMRSTPKRSKELLTADLR